MKHPTLIALLILAVGAACSATPRVDALDADVRARALAAMKNEREMQGALSTFTLRYAAQPGCEFDGDDTRAIAETIKLLEARRVTYEARLPTPQLNAKDRRFILERRLQDIEAEQPSGSQAPMDTETALDRLAAKRRQTATLALYVLGVVIAPEKGAAASPVCADDFATSDTAIRLSLLAGPGSLTVTDGLSKSEKIALKAERVRRAYARTAARSRDSMNRQRVRRMQRLQRDQRRQWERMKRGIPPKVPRTPNRTIRNTPAPVPHRPRAF